MAKVVIPYAPRPLQAKVHGTMDKHRFVVAVCHRRFGKSVLAVNELIKGALTCTKDKPRFAYIGPTYRQAKATAWDYLTHFSRPVPGIKVNQSELRIDFPNGGQIRVYGADNPDSLRGIYLDGVVLDEYGMQPGKTFTEVVRPALSDRIGWALFLGTPNGKNQFWDVAQYAQIGNDPEWAYEQFRASQTGYVAEKELEQAKKVMTSDEFAQEFECSFEASVRGAIYSKELEAARSSGRITSVPYDPSLPVDTDWDLGISDFMSIWFSQSLRTGEVRLIDYYENSGEGFPHYAKVLQAKGYAYGKHWAPHDIMVRELSSGRSRQEVAASMGIRFEIMPRIHDSAAGEVEEGIHAARMFLSRCWFDAEKCRYGLESLMHYRREYNQRLNEFKASPVHDSASHGADAFRGLAVRHKTPAERKARQSVAMPAAWSWA